MFREITAQEDEAELFQNSSSRGKKDRRRGRQKYEWNEHAQREFVHQIVPLYGLVYMNEHLATRGCSKFRSELAESTGSATKRLVFIIF